MAFERVVLCVMLLYLWLQRRAAFRRHEIQRREEQAAEHFNMKRFEWQHSKMTSLCQEGVGKGEQIHTNILLYSIW